MNQAKMEHNENATLHQVQRGFSRDSVQGARRAPRPLRVLAAEPAQWRQRLTSLAAAQQRPPRRQHAARPAAAAGLHQP